MNLWSQRPSRISMVCLLTWLADLFGPVWQQDTDLADLCGSSMCVCTNTRGMLRTFSSHGQVGTASLSAATYCPKQSKMRPCTCGFNHQQLWIEQNWNDDDEKLGGAIWKQKTSSWKCVPLKRSDTFYLSWLWAYIDRELKHPTWGYVVNLFSARPL